MKIIFMGNPEFACPSLKAISSSSHQIIGVVSNPPKRMKRSSDVSYTPIGNLARKLNLDLFTPEKLSNPNLKEWIVDLKPDILVVVAFKILPKTITDIPNLKAVNLHASLLPKYRGAAPIHHALINGDTVTGNTTFLIQPKVDTGNIILQQKIDIKPNDNFATLSKKMSELGAELLIESLNVIENPNFKPISQDSSVATFAPKIDKSFGKIDWSESAHLIYSKIKALSFSPGTFANINGKRLKIYESRLTSKKLDDRPGAVVCIDNKIFVSCLDFSLELIDVQFEGKKKMSAIDWFRGINEHSGLKFDQ